MTGLSKLVSLFKAYCPKCRYTTHSNLKRPNGSIYFKCTCKCEWNLKQEYCEKVG